MNTMSAITVTTTGAIIAFGAASTNVALPNASDGKAPRLVRLAATAACYVKLGTSAGVTAAAGDLLVQPADTVVIRAIGFTHIAALQVTADGTLQISPVENV